MAWRRFLLSFCIEFGPIIVFFIASRTTTFLGAVAALVIASPLSLIVSMIKDKRLPLFALINTTAIVTFGTLTLLAENPTWIVLEYSLYNLLYGSILLYSGVTRRLFLKRLFETMLDIADEGWFILSRRWGIFMLTVSLVNGLVWYFYGEEIWITFRLGMIFCFVFFAGVQFSVTKKFRLENANFWGIRSH